MPSIKVAHIQQQGVDLIIAPLEPSFEYRPENEQRSVVAELQARATAASLRGTVVPVWDAGGGRMAFLAPTNWHAFFLSISLTFVWANVNRQINW